MAMTTKERILRMYNHKEADRIPIIDSPWSETIERWENEGMPKGMPFYEYFDIDKIQRFSVDISPRYPEIISEETEEYQIEHTQWGATLRRWKHASSTPEFMNFAITDPDKWRDSKALMTPSEDRIDWKQLDKNYKYAKEKGYWLRGRLWFGFDITHSWVVGTETLLIAMYENPEWVMEMFNYFLDMEIAHWEMIIAKGYEFDDMFWYDDMGYKENQFFSIDMYREIVKPVHKRAVEWAHSKGFKTMMHSCGYIEPFIPDLVEIGLDALNPLEVKAGMNPERIKENYGDKLMLQGGINAVLWDQKDNLEEEIRRVVPIMKENGGYMFSSDHSVPPSASLENFKFAVDLAKELGSY